MYVYMYVHTHTHTHTHIYIYIYIYIYMCTTTKLQLKPYLVEVSTPHLILCEEMVENAFELRPKHTHILLKFS